MSSIPNHTKPSLALIVPCILCLALRAYVFAINISIHTRINIEVDIDFDIAMHRFGFTVAPLRVSPSYLFFIFPLYFQHAHFIPIVGVGKRGAH